MLVWKAHPAAAGSALRFRCERTTRHARTCCASRERHSGPDNPATRARAKNKTFRPPPQPSPQGGGSRTRTTTRVSRPRQGGRTRTRKLEKRPCLCAAPDNPATQRESKTKLSGPLPLAGRVGEGARFQSPGTAEVGETVLRVPERGHPAFRRRDQERQCDYRHRES